MSCKSIPVKTSGMIFISVILVLANVDIFEISNGNVIHADFFNEKKAVGESLKYDDVFAQYFSVVICVIH